MSLTMKTLMTALLLIAVTAQWNTASAQMDQMRLWSPPQSNQFGGYDRLREGPFGGIEYNYWTITKGRDRTIGWVKPDGQNLYFNGNGFQYRTNTMSTSSLGNNFTGGVTLRVGNMIKHHGWEIKSTIMQPQKDSYLGRSGSMDISDDAVLNVSPMQNYQAWYYDRDDNAIEYLMHPNSTQIGRFIQSGYLWGWFYLGGASTVGPGEEVLGPPNNTYLYGLAPLPITFDRYKIESKISHWDVEANYIFRAHATKIGFFEFTGGVRYMQLDDNLTFSGWGLPWRGNVRIETDGDYSGENTPDTAPNTGTGTGSTTAESIDITEYYLANGSLPGDPRNYMYTGTMQGAGTVLADSRWNFEAQNHLVGPQVGIRYIKKCSGRWSLIADTKFFAGFNTQNIKSHGVMGSPSGLVDLETLDLVGNNDSDDAYIRGAGIVPWIPIGTMQNPGTFRHSQTRTAFSPGIDFSLKANWQFTDAIAFNVGYQGMYLDRTARASLINNYQIAADGTIFGINDKVTQSTFLHGVSLGMTINRF